MDFAIVNRKIDVNDKNYFFGASPAGFDDDWWDYYKKSGIKSIRLHLQYHRFCINNSFDFSVYDEVCLRAVKEDIEIMMLVSYESYPSNGEHVNGQLIYTDQMNLIPVLKVAIPHFKNKGVTSWEIWNEENHCWKVNAIDYAKMLATIYENCKYTEKWDPDANIILGGLDAMANGCEKGVRTDCRDYLEAIYHSPSYKEFYKKYSHSPFDAIGLHNYMTVDVNNRLHLDYDMFESSLQGVVYDITDANHDSEMPVWITEVGDPDAIEELQAAKLHYYIRLAYHSPRVKRFHWFTLCFPDSLYQIFGRQAAYEYQSVISELTNANNQPVTSISLNLSNIKMPLYAQIMLKAFVQPFHAISKDVVWECSNSKIVSVQHGFLTAQLPGNAVVTAFTADGKFQASCMVTVNNTADVSFKVGTYEEYMHLLSANCSPYAHPSIKYRFADQKQSFTYKINLDKQKSTAVLSVEVFQQYLIELSCDNKNWTAAAKETNPNIRDESNKKILQIPLDDYLKYGVVYIKVSDSFPNDGWGGAVCGLSVSYT